MRDIRPDSIMLFRALLVIYGLYLTPFLGLSQHNEVLNAVSQQLEQMVDAYVTDSVRTHRFSHDTIALTNLYHLRTADSILLHQFRSLHEAEMTSIKADLGLEWKSGFAQNFFGALLEEDGTFYDWRLQSGLEWDILKSGWISGRQLAKQKQLEWNAREAEIELEAREKGYRELFDFIIFNFNLKKIALIERRLQILEELVDIGGKLFYLKYMPWENVLDFMSKKAETELFLHNYQTYIDAVQLDSTYRQLQISTLPLFDIDFQKVEEEGIDTMSSYLALENKIQALNHHYHWSKDVTLLTQLRYSHYYGTPEAVIRGRDFMTGGVTLGLPLPLSRKNNKKLVEEKAHLLNAEYASRNQTKKNELLTHFYEYQYSLKQFVHFYYQRERTQVLLDRSLRQRNLEDPNYSPVQVVDRLDALFSIDLELLDIQQKLYLKALKIFTLIGKQDILPYIKILDYGPNAQKFAAGNSIFIDRNDFASIDGVFLLEFLDFNQIRELLVEASAEPDLYLKYAELLDQVNDQSRDLRIKYALVPTSSEQLTSPDWMQEVQLSLTTDLHLDLTQIIANDTSPSTQLITHILTVVTALTAGHTLSISLPLQGTKDLRKLLYPFVSELHLVPSHSEDLAGLFHLFSGQSGEDPDKIRLTVKPQDFNSRLEMDNFSKELKRHLSISQLGIASFGDMLLLEQQTVGWNEERRF